jgi:hypothetical protein
MKWGLTILFICIRLSVWADSLNPQNSVADTLSVVPADSAANADSTFRTDSTNLQLNKSGIPLPEIDDLHFRKRQPNRWVFFITCGIIILLGFNRILNIKRHDQLLFGSVSGMTIKSNEAVFRELSVHQILAVLIIAFTGGLALLMWLPIPIGTIFQSTFSKYFFWVSMVIFIYALKAFFYYLVIAILRIRDLSDLLFSQFIMITYSLFLLWLPILLIWNYNPTDWIHTALGWLAFALAVIFFIIRFVRTLQAMAMSFPYSNFYLFLYLCCLEILPWAVVAQVYRIWAL